MIFIYSLILNQLCGRLPALLIQFDHQTEDVRMLLMDSAHARGSPVLMIKLVSNNN